MSLEKAGNNVLYIFTDFFFIFLPNSTVKPCET